MNSYLQRSSIEPKQVVRFLLYTAAALVLVFLGIAALLKLDPDVNLVPVTGTPSESTGSVTSTMQTCEVTLVGIPQSETPAMPIAPECSDLDIQYRQHIPPANLLCGDSIIAPRTSSLPEFDPIGDCAVTELVITRPSYQNKSGP